MQGSESNLNDYGKGAQELLVSGPQICSKGPFFFAIGVVSPVCGALRGRRGCGGYGPVVGLW